MDQTAQHASSGTTALGNSYQHTASQAQQQMQHGQTLPPLQPHEQHLGPIFPNHQQGQQTPGGSSLTPQPPISNYPPPPSHNAGRGSYQMPHSSYPPPPHQGYGGSSANMPPTSIPTTHPQLIAPAPSPGGRVPPVLRPMPGNEMSGSAGLPSPYDQSSLLPPPPSGLMDNGEMPTHVVGSQGRRGILPTAPGRPAPPQPGTAMAKNQIPQKDADGKFPCPHCTKTYLHAKHLKRHLLRHTGDRPYMCVLCRDTFSRSDILKRHFQKCSIRRGNPTGASHLSHPHAHVKKGQADAQAQEAAAAEQAVHGNGIGQPGAPGDPMTSFSLLQNADPVNQLAAANDQSHLSRGSSINRLDDPNVQDRSGVPTPVMTQAQYNSSTPTSMAAALNPQLASYGMPAAQNGMSMYGPNTSQPNNIDWSQVFSQGGAQNTFNSQYPSNSRQTQIGPKAEPKHEDEMNPTGAALAAPNPSDSRPLDGSNIGHMGGPDTYQHLSSQILRFFYPPEVIMSDQSVGMNLYFSPTNVEDFLDKYRHFHQHFAILHLPTFRALDAYIGLVASMCCIGACYSDLVSSDHVRDMIDFVKIALERDSRMLASLEAGSDQSILTSLKHDNMEELQALILMHLLHLWNGNPEQRSNVDRTFAKIASLARNLELLHVSTDPKLFSNLHQPGPLNDTIRPSDFDWAMWIEQEKRVRVMHSIFNMDVALGLYFNKSPQFDVFSIQIPLPCDDAAWDADDTALCAQSLGLYGAVAAKECNFDGTQHAKQPELHLIMSALLDPAYEIQSGTTNLLGKFIIIHAILGLLRRAQFDMVNIVPVSTIALAQKDWIVAASVAYPQVTGSSGSNPSDHSLAALDMALDKFKRNWDVDVVTQHPPASNNPRRYGFSKDAIPFYWLAMYMIKGTQSTDFLLAPDQRFTQVMHLLKSAKNWVLSDGATRGEGMGSVGEIDQDYGTGDLTLDMASLFKPIPTVAATTREVGRIKSEVY